jgi:hypothetical protein
MAASKVLPTWDRAGENFAYTGSVTDGTTIQYGEDFKWTAKISAVDYARILQRFSGRQVQIGTSKDTPPVGSVGEWVKANVNRSGLMSYIGPILIEEGFAVKPKRGWIRFHHHA